MADLTNLDSLTGDDLTESQIRGLIRKIDLNIANLMNDGKLGAARIAENYAGGQSVDRTAALQAMLQAREFYQYVMGLVNDRAGRKPSKVSMHYWTQAVLSSKI